MKEQQNSDESEQKEKGNDQKVMRLFDHTHFAEKQRAKELQQTMYLANRNQFFMQVIIMITCGIYAIAIVNEMSEDLLRYKYLENNIFLAIIFINCFFFSGVIGGITLKYNGDFRKAHRLVLVILAIYLICSQFIFFEICLMCKLYTNPLLIILMNNQAKIFVYTISPNRAHFIYVGVIHIMLLYATLRILLEFQIFQYNIASSIIICILLIISFISQMIERRQSSMEKSFREKLIAAQQGEISNIKKFYTNILQYIPHGIAIIDEQMQVLFANTNLHQILNCSKNEDLFQSLNKLNFGNVSNLQNVVQQEKQITPPIEQRNGQGNFNNQKVKTSKNQIASKPQIRKNESFYNEGFSLNNTNNQILINNQFAEETADVENKNSSINHIIQGIGGYESREQSMSFDIEHKIIKKNSLKEHSLVKISDSCQPSQDIPISSSPKKEKDREDSKQGSFKLILERIFTSSTKQTSSHSHSHHLHDNISTNQQNPSNNISNAVKKEVAKVVQNAQCNGGQNNNCSPQINSRKHSTSSEVTPYQKISNQSFDKANLYEEEACEIEANSSDGKKLNIKLVLYDLDLEKEVEEAFNSFNIVSPLQDSEERETQLRLKRASQSSVVMQKQVNQLHQQVQQSQKNLKVNDKLNGNKYMNQKNSQIHKYIQQSAVKNGPIHEQLIVMIIEDQSQAQKVKRLEDQNEYKMRMLASVSHELRTPLNCSISMLQIMRENLVLLDQKDMIKNNLDPALYSSKILLNLINDILDFAQLEAGKFKITRQDFSLKKILQECLILISIQSRMKNINLCLQIGHGTYEEYNSSEQIESAFDPINPLNKMEDKFMIHSDPNRVRQIVLNLLSNALKFTNQGQITLKAEIVNKKPLAIKITCEDTGIGIPPERYSTIFDNFNKADLQNRIKYNQCGAGLGLSISNQLAKMLCPTEYQCQPIVVVSQVGKGSSFSFVIQDQLSEDIPYAKNLMQFNINNFGIWLRTNQSNNIKNKR